jgi:hypothetical protein
VSNEDITADTIKAAIDSPNPMMEALSNLLKTVAHAAVENLSDVLRMLGVDPVTMPGAFFAQALLVEADKAFVPISREEWINVYDSYQQIKAILAGNPDLREALYNMHDDTAQAAAETPHDALLDGKF